MFNHLKLIAIACLLGHLPAYLALKPPNPVYNATYKWPTVAVTVLVRNKAHTLPYFLSCLNNLDYPKDRMFIWVYSDYNNDNSIEILREWEKVFGPDYNGVNITADTTTGPLHPDEDSPLHWSMMHYNHVIQLRETALNFARKKWADFMFMIDADAFITHPKTLKALVHKDLTIVAPMLVSDSLYSNFWCGMTDQYYYQRTDEYKPIVYREDKGCFNVPMVHTAVLVSLRHKDADRLTYNHKKVPSYDGPQDDIITFAVNALKNGIKNFICNDFLYGFLVTPLEETVDIKEDLEQLRNVKLEALGRNVQIPLMKHFERRVSYPKKSKYGVSEIFMINLERREMRRNLMAMSFKELGMDVTLFTAVDGRNISLDKLDKLSITLMPNYEDPYYKRPMKAGEVGCFLSHYSIWEMIVKKRYAVTMILEDDVHFVPHFQRRFKQVQEELNSLDWDFMYMGRKVLQDEEEEYVTEHITKPLYSYWTLGYLITLRGAQKLIASKPLTKMLPVDEYLPIMFNQHPNDTWKSLFPRRNLIAFSAAPLLINPTFYTGQEGYISDTEDSDVIEVYKTTNKQFVRTDF
ncbi:glycosyltransferase 25 family member [Epargyreus clarus]|uniref:glycosyltransferase 25 family member n=1 Tax=Epargyreus clarus TaxID=520877 RepID=UPI003C30346C